METAKHAHEDTIGPKRTNNRAARAARISLIILENNNEREKKSNIFEVSKTTQTYSGKAWFSLAAQE